MDTGILLYHGTRVSNMSSISQLGLQASQTGRLGQGLYFTTKDCAHAISKYKGQGTGVVVFECRVDLQNCFNNNSSKSGSFNDEKVSGAYSQNSFNNNSSKTESFNDDQFFGDSGPTKRQKNNNSRSDDLPIWLGNFPIYRQWRVNNTKSQNSFNNNSSKRDGDSGPTKKQKNNNSCSDNLPIWLGEFPIHSSKSESFNYDQFSGAYLGPTETVWQSNFDSCSAIHPPWVGLPEFPEWCIKDAKKCKIIKIYLIDGEVENCHFPGVDISTTGNCRFKGNTSFKNLPIS